MQNNIDIITNYYVTGEEYFGTRCSMYKTDLETSSCHILFYTNLARKAPSMNVIPISASF